MLQRKDHDRLQKDDDSLRHKLAEAVSALQHTHTRTPIQRLRRLIDQEEELRKSQKESRRLQRQVNHLDKGRRELKEELAELRSVGSSLEAQCAHGSAS